MTATLAKRAFKYRFYPTEPQARELLRTFGCVRLVYNKALGARFDLWQTEQRRLDYEATSAMLTGWKREPELSFLNEVSSVPLQQTLRHLQAAFTNFFTQRARRPKFKSRKRSRESAEYTRSGFRWRAGTITLAKMSGPLDIVWSRPLPAHATPSTVTVSRDPAGRWFVSIQVEAAVVHHAPVARTVGVDAGITALLTFSTGERINNPRHERRERAALSKAQRSHARKTLGSANRDKARRKIARVHARITDRRRDFLHKLTTRLVRENQTIVIEDLNVAGMVRNRSLARAISDASWSQFRHMLEYKAAWYGRDVVVVDRWFPSSKACSTCGRLGNNLPLNVREWTCAGCGNLHDRDVNAARNILAAGLAATACGDGVSPTRR